MHLVRLKVKLLKCLGVKHTNQKVERHIVAVRNDAEDSLLAFPQFFQLHRVRAGDPLHLRQGERSQPHGSGNQNAHSRLTGSLLEHLILPQGDMAGVFLLQRLKQKIQRGLIIAVALFRRTVFQHGEHHFHGLLLWRRLMQKIQHKGTV